jgi:hypothetical protein
MVLLLFCTNKLVNFYVLLFIAGRPPDAKKIGGTVLVPGAAAPTALLIVVILRIVS